MTLENQCSSLEQSKRLVELGINAPSIFCHNEYELHHCIKPSDDNDNANLTLGHYENGLENFVRYGEYKGTYPAFTVAELGAMLPYLNINYWKMSDNTFTCEFTIVKDCERKGEKRFNGNLPSCLADCLIYLLENKLITPEECNARLAD